MIVCWVCHVTCLWCYIVHDVNRPGDANKAGLGMGAMSKDHHLSFHSQALSTPSHIASRQGAKRCFNCCGE